MPAEWMNCSVSRQGRRIQRVCFFFLFVIILLVAIIALSGREIWLLEFKNITQKKTIHQQPVSPDKGFNLEYTHSIYNVPVQERFVINNSGMIILKDVISPSEAALEYFGITKTPGISKDFNLEIPSISLKSRTSGGFIVKLHNATVPVNSLGDDGDVIQIKVAQKSLIIFLMNTAGLIND